ncbi:MAG: hypothetical protein IPK98_19825 [Chloracidobacterium sp.]|nr:hypothetical protein [Chloracidobacterium sp.]
MLTGEDARFFQHNGFDWDAIQKLGMRRSEEGKKEDKQESAKKRQRRRIRLKRGCKPNPEGLDPSMPSFKRGARPSRSTAKNLFLSEDPTFSCKGTSIPISRTRNNQKI